MADAIFELLVSFFCPTSDSASICNEFISNHSQVLPPIGPLFYFLLFPLVFTILFVYILSSTILHGGKIKWMQMLIGISVFIFIIINGWYPIMLYLSEVWFILIIVLFGMWYFLTRHKGSGEGGGGKKGGMPGVGGAMGALMNVKIERDEIHLAQSSIGMAKRIITEIEEKKTQRSAENMREIEEALRSAQVTVNNLLLNPIHSQKAMELQQEIRKLQEKAKKI
jgi:hypothetical protein